MIEDAQKNLKDLGMADKFELICQDIFDESFNLPEKVDCVVLSYTLTTFISNYEMLVKIIKRCSEQVTLGFQFLFKLYLWRHKGYIAIKSCKYL